MPSSSKLLFDATVARIDNLSGFSGSLTLRNGSRIVLPATDTWDDDLTVTVEDSSAVYLPFGKEVDETKILGTANYKAVGRGIGEEPRGTIELTDGEELVICGDGFTSDTTIAVKGFAAVYAPFDVNVASPFIVDSSASMSIEVTNGCTAVFSGDWDISGSLLISNNTATASSPAGKSVFAGKGAVRGGGVCHRRGDVEFYGNDCQWVFEAGTKLVQEYQAIMMRVSEGAGVELKDGTDTNRSGFTSGCINSYIAVLQICTNSFMRIGAYRKLQMGIGNWGCHVLLDVNGGVLYIKGETGQFDLGGQAAENLQNNNNDRCPIAEITIRNGGVIETDRTCSSPPITHQLDKNLSIKEGLHVYLDNGTWRLGEKFGSYSLDRIPHQHPNLLFGGATMMNVATGVKLTNTCEVTVNIGAGGGTFDMTSARPGNTSFTNTAINLPIPVLPNKYETQSKMFPEGYYPTLGPRWNIDGRLTVKGNGNQELVLYGLDAAKLTQIGADGATVKVVSENPASVSDLVLGDDAGGWTIETEDGEPGKLTIGTVSVAAGGALDPSFLATPDIEVTNVVFGTGAVLHAPATDTAPLIALGTVTLSESMGYYSAVNYSGPVLAAKEGIVQGNGVNATWFRADGSKERRIRVQDDCISFESVPLKIILR